jgi:uridine kinase
MIGDRLIFESQHFDKSKTIIKHLSEIYPKLNLPEKFIITIGGTSGTGKTEISILLQEQLFEESGIRSYVISLDDYYRTSWLSRREKRIKKGIKSVGMKEINWSKVYNMIESYVSPVHKYFKVQRIHKYINDIEECKVKRKSIDALIIEGLYANYIEDSDLAVYLEGSYKNTEKFRIKRNKEVRDNFRLEILKKEQEEVKKTKVLSDLIIPF